MRESKEYLDLIAEVRSKHSPEDLRAAFVGRTHEALFRRIAWTARPEVENASPIFQAWVGFELAVDGVYLGRKDEDE